jgi:4-hydroxy-2-oxoheptanedioate aldolase
MQRNVAKARLLSGETVFGCFVRYRDVALAELLGYQSWDFLVFDAEHSTLEPRDCENLVRATELRGLTSIVRVTTNLPHVISRFLDTGAQGIQVPMINSAAEAERAMCAAKFGPRGFRGLAGVRAADYGQTTPFDAYVKMANHETLVIVQIETVEALAQVPEIARTDGVDVVFIGPTDLSLSLGVPGQPQHQRVREAVEKIASDVAKAGKILGAFAFGADSAREWRERGARYLVTNLEMILLPGVRQYLEKARS